MLTIIINKINKTSKKWGSIPIQHTRVQRVKDLAIEPCTQIFIKQLTLNAWMHLLINSWVVPIIWNTTTKIVRQSRTFLEKQLPSYMIKTSTIMTIKLVSVMNANVEGITANLMWSSPILQRTRSIVRASINKNRYQTSLTTTKSMIDWKDLIWISTQSTELAFQEIMVIKFKDPAPKIFYKVMDLFPTWVLIPLNSQDIEEIINMLNPLTNTQEVIFLWEVKAPMLILISKKSQKAMIMSTIMIN